MPHVRTIKAAELPIQVDRFRENPEDEDRSEDKDDNPARLSFLMLLFPFLSGGE